MEHFEPTPPPPERPYIEEALDAWTEVVCEHGRWVVYLHVMMESGAVKRRVAEEHDERRAEHTARIFLRNVIRYIPPAPKEATP